MRENWMLRFLYRTTVGRFILKILVNPKVSQVAGAFLNSRLSRVVVPYYIRKNKIDMSEILVPANGFASFNDFFTRKRKSRKVPQHWEDLSSPCDGFLSCIEILENAVFDIKHTRFTLERLLGDRKLAKEFYGGTALVFRLTPANYHRYAYASDGRIEAVKRIEGQLHCVRPIATRTVPVFAENSREYQVISTEPFGKIIQMEIGALLVGKISNHKQYRKGSIVWAGDEKGYFEFGGSTILLLFEKDRLCLNKKFCRDTDSAKEIPVRLGDVIGTAKI